MTPTRENCHKCQVSLNNSKEILECNECKLFFHPTCTKIRTLENFRKLGARKANWKCDECKGQTPASSLLDGGIEDGNLNSVKDSLTELINEKFSELNSNISTLNRTVDSLRTSLDRLREENITLKNQCNELRSENSKLKRDINDLQQYSRLENLEIVGVPETKNENVYSVLESIAESIGIQFKSEEVSIAHRVPSAKNNIKPIVVRFTSRLTKMNWKLASKKKGRLCSSELKKNLPSSTIYINDHLTPYNKFILGKARKLKQNKKLSYVWVKETKILVRKEQDSPVKRIFSEEDLRQFE